MSGDTRRIDPNTLGIIIGAAVLALTVALLFVFKHRGLPKDPEVWKRIEQQRSAGENP